MTEPQCGNSAMILWLSRKFQTVFFNGNNLYRFLHLARGPRNFVTERTVRSKGKNPLRFKQKMHLQHKRDTSGLNKWFLHDTKRKKGDQVAEKRKETNK